MNPSVLPIDAGLLARFRSAGSSIAWRAAPKARAARPPRRARIAHLHEEDARVEEWGPAPHGAMEVDSGPLGALVVLLEIDRRRATPRLESRDAGIDPAFPQGGIRATWGGRGTGRAGPTIPDLVELARYALA